LELQKDIIEKQNNNIDNSAKPVRKI